MAQLDSLPSEIIFHIARFLEPHDIVTLQHVNRRLNNLARDNTLWREQSFLSSSFLPSLRRRQDLLADSTASEDRLRDLARALATGNGQGDSRLVEPRTEARDFKARSNERIRILANWDPSYPNEKVNWYDEYIARNAPISISWLQQPKNRDSAQHEQLEVRGMNIYTPCGEKDATLVVAPVDDGSVSVWSLDGTQRGRITARSKPGLITGDRSGLPPKKINLGATECVSVDNFQNRGYFAVQRSLVEVDLETLAIVSHEMFPWEITALSEAKGSVPITVGTNLALYLHDPRVQQPSQDAGDSGQLDTYDATFGTQRNSGSLDFRSLLDPAPNSLYTHLQQSGPLSILHLPSSGDQWDGNGEIYVAGRFSNILNYDRRFFPRLRGTIHSGARLCSMTSLPYPFASLEKDLARRGELTTEQVYEAKTRPGKTLIACGEYNTKGSLEMYGLSPEPHLTTISSDVRAGGLQNSVMKNRQTSSSSKLLSVANHGTRIVVSDGNGNLKWLERDGFTEARRWNISHGSTDAPRGIFGTVGDSYMDSGSGDIIVKIANTQNGRDGRPVNGDDLVLWTGEKLGLLSFSSKPGFTAETFEDTGHKTAEDLRKEQQERTHSETMRRALEANANEVRWLRGMGLGPA